MGRINLKKLQSFYEYKGNVAIRLPDNIWCDDIPNEHLE